MVLEGIIHRDRPCIMHMPIIIIGIRITGTMATSVTIMRIIADTIMLIITADPCIRITITERCKRPTLNAQR